MVALRGPKPHKNLLILVLSGQTIIISGRLYPACALAKTLVMRNFLAHTVIKSPFRSTFCCIFLGLGLLSQDFYPRQLEVIREYIQNASDALDAYSAIAKPDARSSLARGHCGGCGRSVRASLSQERN